MNANSQAITIFCSSLCVPGDLKPLEPHEWTDLAETLMNLRLEPRHLLNFTLQDFMTRLGLTEDYSQRLLRLMDRSAGLFSEVQRYAGEGVYIYTRADRQYPSQLKRKLGKKCPPLFYCAGDMALLDLRYAGYAGSRIIDNNDSHFTRLAVKKTCSQRLGVVSGAADGVDSVAAESAISEGWPVVEYVAGGLSALLKKKDVKDSIAEGRRVVLSEAVPNAGFDVSWAMSRNRYIYTQSEISIVIRSDLNKGGTWSGATDNLKHKWCPLFCRNADYPGNKELIRMGAVPIDDGWELTMKVLGRNVEPKKQIEIHFTR